MAVSRRDCAKFVAALAVSSVMASTGSAFAAPAAKPRDPLALVDPELRPAAREILRMTGQMPAPSEKNLAAMRSGIAAFERPRLPNIPVAQRRIPGAGGASDVLVYVINARPGTSRPGILHTHGGGFVMGSAKASIRDLQELASALDAVAVTVEYRLAPEARYSGSIEDNYAGLKWMHAHSGELGLDPARIAVMGESAGGGHAALLAIAARDRGEVPIIFQALVYPMLDDRTGSSRAVPAHIGELLWTAESNRFGWRSFLGQEPGTATVPARAVPARTPDLRGLPPAWIGVGSIDLFVDEDVSYGRRLFDSAVPTELLVVPGAFHGFDGIAAGTSVARRFTEAKLNALKRAFINGHPQQS